MSREKEYNGKHIGGNWTGKGDPGHWGKGVREKKIGKKEGFNVATKIICLQNRQNRLVLHLAWTVFVQYMCIVQC